MVLWRTLSYRIVTLESSVSGGFTPDDGRDRTGCSSDPMSSTSPNEWAWFTLDRIVRQHLPTALDETDHHLASFLRRQPVVGPFTMNLPIAGLERSYASADLAPQHCRDLVEIRLVIGTPKRPWQVTRRRADRLIRLIQSMTPAC